MMKLKKRYSFWKVFWVVLGLNIIFTVLGFIALSVSPMYSKEFNWSHLFTWHYLLSQVISIAFSSAFYFLPSTVTIHFFMKESRRVNTSSLLLLLYLHWPYILPSLIFLP